MRYIWDQCSLKENFDIHCFMVCLPEPSKDNLISEDIAVAVFLLTCSVQMVLTNDRLTLRKCVTLNSFCMCKSAREVRDSDLPTLQLLGSCDVWPARNLGHIGYLVADTIGQHGKSAGGVGDAWKIWWQTQSRGM